MSGNQYYHQCSNGIGKCVRIRTHDGKVHTGIIDRVTRNKVFIRPLGGSRRNYGGFGFGYYRGYGPGPGWGFGWGFAGAAIGISLGLIAALAFIPFF